MNNSLIPAFDATRVFIEPWVLYFESYVWIALMGFFVSSACGVVGCFIILRRMALIGDAISHSILPGIALAFLVTSSRGSLPMVIGAVLAGMAAVVLIELIQRKCRVKSDAALGVVFTTLFALGVILITVWADHVDLDADCVLYGEIAFVPLTEKMSLAGVVIAPVPVVRMAIVLMTLIACIAYFYKELLVTSFDPVLANTLGIRSWIFHYGLMIALSITIVGAFESVGAILVIAMLIFPGATASLLFQRLPAVLIASVVFSFLYAIGGLHLALWLNCSIAGAMAVVGMLLFCCVWIGVLFVREYLHFKNKLCAKEKTVFS